MGNGTRKEATMVDAWNVGPEKGAANLFLSQTKLAVVPHPDRASEPQAHTHTHTRTPPPDRHPVLLRLCFGPRTHTPRFRRVFLAGNEFRERNFFAHHTAVRADWRPPHNTPVITITIA